MDVIWVHRKPEIKGDKEIILLLLGFVLTVVLGAQFL